VTGVKSFSGSNGLFLIRYGGIMIMLGSTYRMV
jgi:hypothetical protein